MSIYNNSSIYGGSFVQRDELIAHETIQFKKTGDNVITSDYLARLSDSFVLRFFVNRTIKQIVCFGAAVIDSGFTPSYNSSDPYGGDIDYPSIAKADLSDVIGQFNSITQYSASLSQSKTNTFGFACTFKNGVFMLRSPRNVSFASNDYNALTPVIFNYG